ncbi:PHP-associated domain-containing protein [Halopelagius longus]|uniref:PHP domain-containing protein n=1 Tax=Halopelagius longus TaxID=1236180 RepID=A0A1H1DBU2_9EURY|nr:PHP-associated domain-containing protein [Halopelagius longus]RDI73022.1 PHP domain-containing protein [Halopelagius longus]SDQ73708.1 Predicted metal-dependent phosphoesterase TrpH, contains PHP domain [Halopelagius longus]
MHVKILDERVVARAKDRGIDVLVYAPHFVRLPDIRERAAEFSDDELLVVPAREVFTGSWRRRRHLLAVGLSDPVPDFISMEGAFATLAEQEAAVLVPHPTLLTVSLGRDEIAAHRDEIHAVETYNAKSLPYHNRAARDVAREFDLPGFGSSYAHLLGSVGEAWTEFDRPIESESDLVAALRSGAPRRVMYRPGLRHRGRALAEFAHLGFENSWGKIDRLFLSGMEPTHPGHIAYDGRFDDVREY